MRDPEPKGGGCDLWPLRRLCFHSERERRIRRAVCGLGDASAYTGGRSLASVVAAAGLDVPDGFYLAVAEADEAVPAADHGVLLAGNEQHLVADL